MIPDDPRWSQMIPDDLRWSQMIPDDPRWSQMIPDDPRWAQISPDDPRWAQISPDDIQMLPRCIPDPRCPPDASHSSPLTCDVSKVPSARFREQKNHCVFLLLKNDMQNRRKKLTKSMLILIGLRVVFHRKSCARGVFVRMPFFVHFLTVSGRLDPRSARAGAVETQFLNLRFSV